MALRSKKDVIREKTSLKLFPTFKIENLNFFNLY